MSLRRFGGSFLPAPFYPGHNASHPPPPPPPPPPPASRRSCISLFQELRGANVSPERSYASKCNVWITINLRTYRSHAFCQSKVLKEREYCESCFLCCMPEPRLFPWITTAWITTVPCNNMHRHINRQYDKQNKIWRTPKAKLHLMQYNDKHCTERQSNPKANPKPNPYTLYPFAIARVVYYIRQHIYNILIIFFYFRQAKPWVR
jgi:hypothetical protein